MKPLNLIILLAFGLIAGVLAKNATDEIKLRLANHERQAQALKERDANHPKGTYDPAPALSDKEKLQAVFPIVLSIRRQLNSPPIYASVLAVVCDNLERSEKELEALRLPDSTMFAAVSQFRASLRGDLWTLRYSSSHEERVSTENQETFRKLYAEAGDLLTVLKAP